MNRRTFMKAWAAIAGSWSSLTAVKVPAAPRRVNKGVSREQFQVRWFVYNVLPAINMDEYLLCMALPAPEDRLVNGDPRLFPIKVENRFEHDGGWLYVDMKFTIEQPISFRSQVAGIAIMHPGDRLAEPMFRYHYQEGAREVVPTDVLDTVVELNSEPVSKRRWLTDADYRDSLRLESGAEIGPKGKQFLQRVIDRGAMT